MSKANVLLLTLTMGVLSSVADGLVRFTDEYRTTGRNAAFANARKCADAILAANDANVLPDDLAALLELSRYVESTARDRYRAFVAARVPSRSDGASAAMEKVFAQQDIIRQIDRDIADVLRNLPPRAGLLGSDRAEWRRMSLHPDSARVVAEAEALLGEPIPDTSDSLYVEFWTTGNRSNYQKPYFRRLVRLVKLTVAESIERKGRFLPALLATIDAICSMKSWVLPAHDSTDNKGGNLRGTVTSVDLFSSQIASHLACTVNFLGDDLPSEAVGKIRAEIERRIFAPLRLSYAHADRDGCVRRRCDPLLNWWICGVNNWNAVCHDNVVTTALALLDDPRERAFFVARALRGLRFYAKGGFAADGYCSEGMGYWNYGYGHLLMLGLTLRDLTDGKIDIFEEPIYRKAAEYAYGYRLEHGVSPSFADGCGAPSPANLALVRRVWPDLTCRAAEKASPFGVAADGVAGIYTDRYVSLLGMAKSHPCKTSHGVETLPLRSEFPVGQVWLMRAGRDMSVAVKGGHNGELHNHNDVGSYYLVSEGKLLSGDPGGEEYTARTFSARRYESKVINSYAHPVPVVDGKLQSNGRDFAAKVLKKEFTDACDIVVLDISGAYEVPHLLSLVRTFRFDRAKKAFSVTDSVKFSKPSAFEEVYTTFAGEKFGTPVVSVSVSKGGRTVRSSEHISNPGKIEPTRHSLAFESPVTEAEITLTFTVAEPIPSASHFRSRPDSRGISGRIWGNDAAPGQAAADRAAAGEVMVVNVPWSFPSNRIDWLFNPTKGRGAFNPEWTWQLNRMPFWLALAAAYRKTGDEKYARAFVRQFSDWLAQTGGVPPEKGFNTVGSPWRTIEEGLRLLGSWSVAFETFRKSPAFTDELLLAFVRSAHAQAKHLLAHGTKGNWLLMEMTGAYVFAVQFPEFPDAAAMRTEALRRFTAAASAQLLPDGLHDELSPDYHNVFYSTVSRIFRLAAANGRDGELPPVFRDLLRRGAEGPLAMMTPGFVQPRFNDCFTVPVSAVMRNALAVFPDREDFRWALSKGLEGRPPAGETPSRFLPYAGFAVMRGGWTPDAAYLAFDVGPLGMAHKHQDKLAFTMWKGGEELVFDDGGGQYERSDFRSYARSAHAHNTLLVDGLGQVRNDPVKMTEPIEAGWVSTSDGDAAFGVYDQGFGPQERRLARHRRDIRFDRMSETFTVTDCATSVDGNEHEYTLLFHLDTTNVAISADGRSLNATYGAGRKWALEMMFDGDARLSVSKATGRKTPSLAGWFVGRNDLTVHPATTVFVTAPRGKERTFTTKLRPYASVAACTSSTQTPNNPNP